MTTADIFFSTPAKENRRASVAAAVTDPAIARVRDLRLDFFRGLAMFIILMAHIPDNFLTLWIPARFGFSDATEIFVFCSGMASAIAFGKVFETRGWAMGTARTALRVWQVYWAHIGMFLVIATLMALLDSTGAFQRNYVNSLNLTPFFNDTASQLPGLLTLTYVPNYFDILPMYLGILAMMPVVVGLRQFSQWAAAAFVVGIWLMANFDVLRMPAEPWSDREWFFNPFGWQLVFFTGFALMRGWIPAPPVRRWLIVLAVLVVLASVPFAYYRILNEVALLREWRDAITFLIEKTDFGLFRYVHFLALAYLAWVIAGPGGARLVARGDGPAARVWRRILAAILKVGQQSLAVFVFSMVLARLIGVGFDLTGGGKPVMALFNLLGFVLIVALAYSVGWFKAQPWRPKAPA